MKTLGREGILLQKETIDLRYVEQLVDVEQLNTLCCLLQYAGVRLFDGKRTLTEIVEILYGQMQEKGVDALCQRSCPAGNLAMPRKQEIFACLNRCRSLRI